MSSFPLFTKAFSEEGFSLWYNPERINFVSYKGEIETAKGCVGIEFSFFGKALNSFPRAYILNRDNSHLKPFHFPHLDTDWQLCFDEGVKVFDKYRPIEMVKYCIKRVKYVINSTTLHDMMEITREFKSYWNPNKRYFGEMMPSVNYAKLQNDTLIGISDDIFNTSRSQNQYIEIYKIPEIPGYANINWPIENINDLYLWLNNFNNLCDEIKKNIKTKIREYCTDFNILLYSQKQKYYFGVEIEIKSPLMHKKHKPHFQETTVNCLSSKNCYIKNRLWIVNSTPDELITSNTDSTINLMNKNILLIGAGTIGGNLANMIVRNGAGVGNNGVLNIIDDDCFEPCNYSRHFLGINSTGMFKAEALQMELIRFSPFSKINALNESVFSSTIFSQEFDLIIDTTGEESLTMWLHEKFTLKNTFVMSTWIRGRGEAVESFVLNNRGIGCHQCFRMSDSAITYSGDEYPLRGSCGSVFVPFSISASMYASLLTIEIINTWLAGNLSHNFFMQRLNPIGGIESKLIEKNVECQICGKNYSQE